MPEPPQAAAGTALPFGATVTILFSDIRGFTEYTSQYGDEAAYEILTEHNTVVRKQIELYGGNVVKTQGDSFMVSFTTARGAILCAVAVQRAIGAADERHGGARIAVGIGINTGEPIQEGGDFFGSTVNLAARLCAAAGPGQILVSETTRYVAGRVEGFGYVDRGLHDLKGFLEPQRLYEVRWAPAAGGAEEGAPAALDEAEGAALEGAVQRAIGVLTRVLAITHRDDAAFRPLLECQAKASDLRLQLSRALSEPRGYTVRRVDEAMLPFADLLMLVESHEPLDDKRWSQIESSVGRAFGRELAVAATGFLGVARSSVWLYDADHTAIQCMELFVSAAGTHESGVELFARDFPGYFAALKSERAIDAHDAHTDPRTREFSEPYLAPLGIAAMLDAPIRVGGRMIGVTCNEHIGAPRKWTADEVQFASSLADLVALALESGRRRETEEQLRTMVEALESA